MRYVQCVEHREASRNCTSGTVRKAPTLTRSFQNHFYYDFHFHFRLSIQIMTQEWYADFVSSDNMTQAMLFEILTAANYMGIKQLLDLACLKVTFQLQGKSAEEIRVILNLPELTPEEEAQARESHPWIFEDPYTNP
jgi:Skp1 family, dimerisation domain